MKIFLKDLIWHKNVYWVQRHSSEIKTQSAQQCGIWLCVAIPTDTLPLNLESDFPSANLSLSLAIRIPSGLCYCKWPPRSHSHLSLKRTSALYSSPGHLRLLW